LKLKVKEEIEVEEARPMNLIPALRGSPRLNPLMRALASKGPAFPLSGDNVKSLRSPTEFYDHLMAGISRAEQRVSFSSLYLVRAILTLRAPCTWASDHNHAV
jgi:hypothetical protein